MSTLSTEEAVAVRDAARAVVTQVERAIVGKRAFIELLAIALLARGHVLIEDIPGVGKTTLAKALARAVGGEFKRIQFTPDLLPGDVTGLSIYNQKTTEFVFSPGPIFANVVLADEINRATPKTQSALLEAMEEAQVTTDGVTRSVPLPFLVIATQNPVEYRGTYPLPEAQMDRFMMRVKLGYPQSGDEEQMLARQIHSRSDEECRPIVSQLDRVETVLTIEETCRLQELVARVHVAKPVRDYIVALTSATRSQSDIALGASPRASLALQRAAQAAAAVAGREFVVPDDVKRLVVAVLAHRLMMQSDGGRSGAAAEAALQRLLHETPIPDVPR